MRVHKAVAIIHTALCPSTEGGLHCALSEDFVSSVVNFYHKAHEVFSQRPQSCKNNLRVHKAVAIIHTALCSSAEGGLHCALSETFVPSVVKNTVVKK